MADEARRHVADEAAALAGALAYLPWHSSGGYSAPDRQFAVAWATVDGECQTQHATCAGGEWLYGDLEDGFTRVRYDACARSVTIENDRFGQLPVFYAVVNGACLFASELKGLLAHRDLCFEVDDRGLADLLAFGYVLNNRTIARGVSCMPGGARLSYAAGSGRPVVESVWSARDEISERTAPPDRRAWDELFDAFQAGIERRCRSARRVGISLSGGLDSRTILSAVDHERHDVRTLTLDVSGGGDQVVAGRIANCAHGLSKHRFLENSSDFFARWPEYVQEMVDLTDGMYYDDACVMMPTLDLYRELGVDVALRGHGGELARMHEAYELRCNRHVYACRTQAELREVLYRSMRSGISDDDFDRFINPDLAERLRGAPRESFDEAFDGVPSTWHVVDQATCVYAEQYLRRQCTPSLAQVRSRVNVALPFLDRSFVELVLRLPPDVRASSRLHRELLKRGNPAMLRVVNANTGARAGAADWVQLASCRMYGALRRWTGYRRWRHYVDIASWLRGPLRPYMDATVSGAPFQDAGWLNIAGVQSAWQAHLAGEKDASRQLTALLYVHMWLELVNRGRAQRAIVDRHVGNGAATTDQRS